MSLFSVFCVILQSVAERINIGCVHVGVRDFAHLIDIDAVGKMPAVVLPRRRQRHAHVQPFRGEELQQDHEANGLGTLQGIYTRIPSCYRGLIGF